MTSEERVLGPPAWRMLPLMLIIIVHSLGANHDDKLFYAAALTGTLAAMSVAGAMLSPWLALLVCGASVGAYLALGFANGPIFLAVPLTAFIASQPRPPSTLRVPLAGALALTLGGLVVRVVEQGASPFVTMWQGVGVCALTLAATAFGGWLHDRRKMREEQSRHAATEEQLRMAQDLHDGVGHGLAVIAMNAGATLHLLDKPELDREAMRRSLEAIRQTSRDSLEALRLELSAIRGPAARRPVNGLPELEALLDRIRAGGLSVQRSGDPGEVPAEVGQAVYAVVQESLTNVLRHAEATTAVVGLRRASGRLLISVQDDGRGAGGHPSGMGIPGMRERVARLGGTLETSSGERGFRVSASIPVPS
jgi:signal transduction histidine kinase